MTTKGEERIIEARLALKAIREKTKAKAITGLSGPDAGRLLDQINQLASDGIKASSTRKPTSPASGGDK